MENKLKEKYGLPTAICMVAGIVVGSGVFFKAQTILQKTGGNMPLGIAAWAIGGAIMLCCILAFAAMAGKFEKVNGVVDYAEAMVGSKYAYYVGWFLSVIYYPCLTSVLSWVCARYTLVFIKSVDPDFPLLSLAGGQEELMGPECIALMLFYLCAAYAVNALSPKIAGKLQVSSTIIKFIPLVLMAVVGIVWGLISGTLTENMVHASQGAQDISVGGAIFSAVCAAAFAYEGWIIATSINSEIKNSKKNLPRALIIGGIIVVAIYIFYYIGVAGGATNEELMTEGATVAFVNVFGNVVGNILNLFIIISCVGTMNGLMLGTCRGMYSLAARGRGIKPKIFREIDEHTNMPNNSAVLALILCAFWGVYFFLANMANGSAWFGPFVFDSSELPVVTLYLMYIPIFIMWMVKAKEEKAVKRYVVPLLATAGSIFMVVASVVSHKMQNVWYLIVFAAVMLVGAIFSKKRDE